MRAPPQRANRNAIVAVAVVFLLFVLWSTGVGEDSTSSLSRNAVLLKASRDDDVRENDDDDDGHVTRPTRLPDGGVNIPSSSSFSSSEDAPEEAAPTGEAQEDEPEPRTSVKPADPCTVPMHFLPWNLQRKHPIALASFPGSGNTWLRALIEQGSRVYSGSVYQDKDLNKTYPGEGRKDPSTVVVKTHYPCPNCWTLQVCPVCAKTFPVTAKMTGPVQRADATVFILRSPFDALLAEFNRLRTGRHSGELSREEFNKIPRRKSYQSVYDVPSWQEFVTQRLVAYKTAAKSYLDRPAKPDVRSPKDLEESVSSSSSSTTDEKATVSTTTPEEDRRWIEDANRALTRGNGLFISRQGKLTKLVFYENLKADPLREMEQVFRFLIDAYRAEGIKTFDEGETEGVMSPPRVAAKCALRQYEATMRAGDKGFQFLRKHTKRFNPWTKEQIKQVCHVMNKWWFPQVWGRCLDGKLQWERAAEKDAGAGSSATGSRDEASDTDPNNEAQEDDEDVATRDDDGEDASSSISGEVKGDDEGEEIPTPSTAVRDKKKSSTSRGISTTKKKVVPADDDGDDDDTTNDEEGDRGAREED